MNRILRAAAPMNRILRAAALLLALAPATHVAAAPPAPARPNLLVIVADDLGWGDVSLHQGTPHTSRLDRLATEGVELRRFYVYPVCSPTRAALLTGRMPRRYGIVNPLGPREAGLPKGLTTLPSTLHNAGYATRLVGKWHVGTASHPLDNGFDHFYGFLGPQIDYNQHTSQNGAPDWQRDRTPLQEPGYSTFLLADEAARSITSASPRQPWYLQVCFNAPHVPVAAPAEFIAKYPKLPQAQATYAADVDALDTGIGRILDALDRSGARNNTLVLFFSDNGAGGPQGGSNGSFRGAKGTMFEGGIHTPCWARWPGHLTPASHTDQPVSVEDVFPTLLDAAGIPTPAPDHAPLDGSSQWTALRDGQIHDRKPIILAGTDNAVIDGNWKLIHTSDDLEALYHLAKDPRESSDVYESFQTTSDRLEALLADTLRQFPAVTARPRPRPGQGPGQGQGGRPGPPR